MDSTALPNSLPASSRPLSGWVWLVPALIAIFIALAPFPRLAATPTERHFRIEAKSFEFTPATLQVNPGDRVTIELVSTDVVHGFYLDSYGLSVTADPGQTATLSFIADRTGVFRFRCPVACGQLHPFMTGKLQVGPNQLFWRAAALGILALGSVAWMAR
jgi:heme/copper-type cytochrome/quinol oxidase subunit 2